MRSARITIALGTWLVALGMSLPAQAIDAAIKCESAKVKAAGKYGFCRLITESKKLKKGVDLPAGFAKCDIKFSLKWGKIERKGTGSCPTLGDQVVIQATVQNDAADLATLISGGTVPHVPGFPATGQTTCWDSSGRIVPCARTGQDGETLAGGFLTYRDNGDGTITDLNTDLTWEKLSRDRSIHDWTDAYFWDDAFAVKIATLNSTAFAGHTDWRLPSVKELLSIVHYERTDPAVDPAFAKDCVAGCTVLTCSCTTSGPHWSSTSFFFLDPDNGLANSAWYVVFGDGLLSDGFKAFELWRVRAVRGP